MGLKENIIMILDQVCAAQKCLIFNFLLNLQLQVLMNILRILVSKDFAHCRDGTYLFPRLF